MSDHDDYSSNSMTQRERRLQEAYDHIALLEQKNTKLEATNQELLEKVEQQQTVIRAYEKKISELPAMIDSILERERNDERAVAASPHLQKQVTSSSAISSPVDNDEKKKNGNDDDDLRDALQGIQGSSFSELRSSIATNKSKPFFASNFMVREFTPRAAVVTGSPPSASAAVSAMVSPSLPQEDTKEEDPELKFHKNDLPESATGIRQGAMLEEIMAQKQRNQKPSFWNKWTGAGGAGGGNSSGGGGGGTSPKKNGTKAGRNNIYGSSGSSTGTSSSSKASNSRRKNRQSSLKDDQGGRSGNTNGNVNGNTTTVPNLQSSTTVADAAMMSMDDDGFSAALSLDSGVSGGTSSSLSGTTTMFSSLRSSDHEAPHHHHHHHDLRDVALRQENMLDLVM